MSRPLRAPRTLVALALLVLMACGADDEPVVGSPSSPTTTAGRSTTPTAGPTTTTTAPGTLVTVAVQGGRVDGPGRQRVALNDTVTLRVTSDVADEVHVHAYEKKAPVGPGQPAEITFVASIPGVFEIELEQAHRLLMTLEVR